MGPKALQVSVAASLCALAFSMLAAGMVVIDPRWWSAAVRFAVLGGIAPMIYTVNARVVPVFARRQWRFPKLLIFQFGIAYTGAVLVMVGVRVSETWVEVAGSAATLGGGMLFLLNLILLFRRQPAGVGVPLPFQDQEQVDRIARRFSMLSVLYLMVGLSTGLVTAIWTPGAGRWELVWAHAMLLGFVVSMANSITYHVLPRWANGRWRSIGGIRAHFVLSVIALPIMLVALGSDSNILLQIGGLLQAFALVIWIVNIVPLVWLLPRPTNVAFLTASGMLLVGISLGAAFAMDSHFGPIYRQVHGEINLFGWAALLILGASYYLLPRFAGRPLRWPRLAYAQLVAVSVGILVGGSLLRLRSTGRGDYEFAIVSTHSVAAFAMLLFAMQAWLTLRPRSGGGAVTAVERPLVLPLRPR